VVSNVFILDKSLKTKLVLTVNGQNTFFKDIYNLNLSTGTESYEFSTNAEDIDESDYIMFHYKDQYKLFQIIEIEQEHSEGKIITSVYGECACLELLNGVTETRTFEGEYDCISFIKNIVLNGSEWQIGKYSASLKDKKVNVKVDKTTQRWTLIQDYMGEFGYEINTRVEYKNGFVKAKYIDVYAEGELGNKTYKRFEYGRNVKGITKKKDLYDFCTALILDTDKVDVKGASYNKDGFTKAIDDDVIYAPTANKTYNAGRDYIHGVYDDNGSDTPGEVIEKAVAELKNRSVPHFDYECDTALTYEEYEDISIGDTVYVIDHSFSPIITLEARVGELEISFTDRDKCKCNLTNYKEKKSGISATLTGSVQSIISTYLPITAKNLAAGAVDPDKVSIETYNIIHADSVKASQGVFEELIVDHAVIKTLQAKDAEIENLAAENLEATNAKIENLKAGYIEADKAVIKDLTAEYIKADEIQAEKIKTDYLEADEAVIGNLTAKYIEADKVITKDLEAANANIGTLNANVANINTLITGNAVMDSTSTIKLTADNATMDSALINRAMVGTINAGKIGAGTINTNLVNIASDTGGVTLTKETMQFKDENDKVRIQIGRDASNNFTFALYDSTGKGQLINENGIQSSNAISDGLIRNGHIDDKANISGGKIDISSLFEEFNKDTNKSTLKSTKVLLDDKNQTLDIAFDSLSTAAESGGRNYQTDSDFSKDKDVLLEKWPSYYNSTNTISTSSNFAGDKVLKNVTDIAKRVEADPEGKARYGRFYAPVITLEKNTKYTLSCWVYIDGSIKEAYASIYTIYDDGTSPVSKGATDKITTTKSWQKIEKTFTTDNTTNKYQVRFYNRFTDGATTGTSTVFIYHPTISKGSKALDWTPAVEDLDGRIETNSTNISVAQGKIETLITDTIIEKENGEVVKLKDAYNSTKDTVDSHVKTIGSIEKDLSGVQSNLSKVTQTANKIEWLVASDASSSSIKLTDKTYEVISKNISLKADKIDLHGYVTANKNFSIDTSGNMTAKNGTFSGTVTGSTIIGATIKNAAENPTFTVSSSGTVTGAKIVASTIQNAASDPTFSIDKSGNIKGASLKSSSGGENGNFSIDSEGNMEVANLAVDGEISSDVIVCKEIRNKAYPKTLTAGCTIYVTSDGDDDNECKEGAKFATLQGAINSIPKNMNGKTVTIHLQKNTTEDVKFNYLSSGRVYLYMNGKTINGYLSSYCSDASVLVYGGDSTSSTTYGKIRPVTGGALASRTISVGCDRSTYLSMYYVQVHAATNQYGGYTGDKVGVASSGNAFIYCSNVKIVDVGVGFRTNSGAHIHMNTSSGIASRYGFQAVTGGRISFSNSNQAGGTTAATNKATGGQILHDTNGPTFESGAAPTPDPTPTPDKVKKTKTFTSSSANAIQYYLQTGAKWRTDSKPKVGTWGYGPHSGWWFFGDDFEEMANKAVYQIDITFTRQSGGNNAAHEHYFYAHDYESQPKIVALDYYATSIGHNRTAINTTATFTITNSTLINAIKTRKGICSIPPEQNKTYYSVFSATMKVKFYYEE
jgi:phage minor structural protein